MLIPSTGPAGEVQPDLQTMWRRPSGSHAQVSTKFLSGGTPTDIQVPSKNVRRSCAAEELPGAVGAGDDCAKAERSQVTQ